LRHDDYQGLPQNDFTDYAQGRAPIMGAG